MNNQRIIIEMGMGNDQYGMDYTKAAGRAIEDAIRHSSLAIFRNTGLKADDMQITVSVGVQEPDKVDPAVLRAKLPYGAPEIRVVKGGLNVTDPAGDATIVIASAAVEVFLPSEVGNWVQTG